VTPGGLALLREIQLALEEFYRLDPAPCVTDFLVEPTQPRHGREQLLILEEQDLFLGLALDPALLEALQSDRLEPANLQEFCLLVEAVSHYLCVIFCARQERPVSVMELELQAEVDKYVACALLAARAPDLSLERLRTMLYDRFELVAGLEPIERLRYLMANHLARRYTRALECVLAARVGWAAVLVELRRFYRLAYQGKQQLIDRR
jgi:hypothetical protein